MIIQRLKQQLETYKKKTNGLFVRSALKEVVQDYVLNFVYNEKTYKDLIFTGGTCLRKVYGLPRLSEDLDFDYLKSLDIKNFTQKVERYFKSDLQYLRLQTKISRNRRTLFLKFPLLDELGMVSSKADSNLLFLRCDFASESPGIFDTEVSQISAGDYVLYVKNYDLSTLFANKIIAFTQREFFKGKEQQIAFKGRDLFDLVWFLEKSAQSGYQIQPNWKRLYKALNTQSKKKIIEGLEEKVRKINAADVYRDLLPFIESEKTLQGFSQNFASLFESKCQYLLQT
jgi:predicted nucleotidyltransferase component of viral defense system